MPTQTKQTSSGSINEFKVTLNESPGSLTYDYTVSGNLSASINNILSNSGQTAYIVVTLSGIDKFKNAIKSQLLPSLENETGIPSQFWGGISGGGSITGSVPSSNVIGSSGQKSIPIKLKASASAPGFASYSTGQSPVTGSGTLGFTPLKIPVPRGFDITQHIPNTYLPTLEFKIKTKSVFYLVSQGSPKLTFKLDPRLFIETESLGNYNCSQLYSSFDSKLTDFEGGVNSLQQRVNSDLSKMKSDRNKLVSSGGGTPLSSLSVSDVSGLGSSTLQSIKSNADNIQNLRNQYNSLDNTYSDIQNSISRIGYSKCQNNFALRFDNISKTFKQLDSKITTIDNTKNSIQSLLSNIGSLSCSQQYSNIASDVSSAVDAVNSLSNPSKQELQNVLSQVNNAMQSVSNNVPSTDPCHNQFVSSLTNARSQVKTMLNNISGSSVLSCANIPQSIRNSVASFSSAADQFTSLRVTQRTPQKKQSLIQEGQNVISTINNSSNISNQNPCKDQLLSRAHSALQKVNSSGVRSQQSLPCKDRFPNVSNQIQSYRSDINNLSAPVTPKAFNQVAKKGDSIVKMIQNDVPSGSGCQKQLAAEVQSLTQRASRLTSRVRISNNVSSGQSSRQSQQIQKLLNEVNSLIRQQG